MGICTCWVNDIAATVIVTVIVTVTITVTVVVVVIKAEFPKISKPTTLVIALNLVVVVTQQDHNYHTNK